jgi:ketosteroid isomerase-like protein
MSDVTETIMAVLERNLQSIWDGDVETYRATTSDDLTFYEWYVCPQRIDGLDFHLHELSVHRETVSGGGERVEHEILNPRVQLFGDTAIATYTLFIRGVGREGTTYRSHHETRVFVNFGGATEPQWKLVHCHKSPIVTAESMAVVRQ